MISKVFIAQRRFVPSEHRLQLHSRKVFWDLVEAGLDFQKKTVPLVSSA